jgi:ribosome-interacting GTPase 1
MNTMTEQTLLKVTIDDIKKASEMGKYIPLIIVINKVEDPDDDEVKEMINQCKANVLRIMQQRDASDLPVSFSVISAMNALYYRL